MRIPLSKDQFEYKKLETNDLSKNQNDGNMIIVDIPIEKKQLSQNEVRNKIDQMKLAQSKIHPKTGSNILLKYYLVSLVNEIIYQLA